MKEPRLDYEKRGSARLRKLSGPRLLAQQSGSEVAGDFWLALEDANVVSPRLGGFTPEAPLPLESERLGRGRPSKDEASRRLRDLLRELAFGATLDAAACSARVDPRRVLRLLDSDEGFRAAVWALIEKRREAA